jgi:hypothetical protein
MKKELGMRLIAHAQRDTGRVADFLLAWWNDAAACGGFDLTNLWNVDDDIAADMVTVFAYLAAGPKAHPDQLGSEAQFQAIVPEWRPEAA